MPRESAAPGESGAITIRDDRERARYEVLVDGEVAGFAEYRLGSRTIIFTHTKIDPEYEGRGLATRLVRHALDDARARGLRVRPICPFFAGYIAEHPEYADLVA